MHCDHGVKGVATQFTGQACALHSWVCVSAGHGAPPPAAVQITSRVRVYSPPPHVLEHVSYPVHSPTVQFWKHGFQPHSSDSSVAGQMVPAAVLRSTIVRVRERDPLPVASLHSLLHGPHSAQDENVQPTGQKPLWQGLRSVVSGQAMPPCFARRVMAWVRRLAPQLQVAEQADQPP